MAFTLQSLRHLLAVADYGSLSRAAEELGITQPALSRSIALLEANHGLKIFERTKVGMALTVAGQLIVEETRLLVRDADSLARSMQMHGRGEYGRVAIGVTPILASILLPTIGKNLTRTSPMARTLAVIDDAERLVRDVILDRIEIAFCPEWFVGEREELLLEHIGTFESAIVVRHGHPLASQGRVTREDLARFPTACTVAAASRADQQMSGDFVCDNHNILREIALETDAVMISGLMVTADDLRDGRLIRLVVEDLPQTRSNVVAVRRRATAVSPLAKRIVKLVGACLA